MLSVLNITSFTLVLGAMGQLLLLGNAAPHFVTRTMFALFLVPWLTVFTISFCRQAPFGPRKFRHCLTFAMCWYAVMTALVETRYCLLPAEPSRHIQVAIAEALIGLGVAGFVVFIRAWLALRSYETSQVTSSGPPG
jgi:hypothetical protein